MARPPRRHVSITKIESNRIYWMWRINDFDKACFAMGESNSLDAAIREVKRAHRKPQKYTWIKDMNLL